MSILLQWASSLIFAGAVSAVVLLLAPKGENQKIIKLAVGAFFICCAALPLINSLPDVNEELVETVVQQTEQTQSISSTVENQVIAQTKQILTQSANEIFQSLQCDGADVQFKLSIDEQNRVTIDDITVTISQNDTEKVEQMCDAFLFNFGKSPTINVK